MDSSGRRNRRTLYNARNAGLPSSGSAPRVVEADVHNAVRSPRSRSVRRLVASTLALVLPAAVAVLAGAPESPAAPAPYTWRNAEIGGGGFVPGSIFNQTQPGLAYARTHLGGAYRRNPATPRRIPLLDSVGCTGRG